MMQGSLCAPPTTVWLFKLCVSGMKPSSLGVAADADAFPVPPCARPDFLHLTTLYTAASRGGGWDSSFKSQKKDAPKKFKRNDILPLPTEKASRETIRGGSSCSRPRGLSPMHSNRAQGNMSLEASKEQSLQQCAMASQPEVSEE
eukprot:6475731-Amphidinium_carterae.1